MLERLLVEKERHDCLRNSYFNRKKLNVKGTLRSIQIAGNLTRFLQVPIKGFTALGVQVALS